jgi:predicted nucleotidyltransferase
MTLGQLKQEPQHLLLKCISGSRAYNLHTATSDTDIKGIFVLPRHELYGLTFTEQLANESNDEVYFEIKRFIDLLVKNNPNILELLSTPDNCVLYRHPLMQLIRPDDFLSKLCMDTFAGYAKTQIKKARGLNKKINRPFEKERKTVLDFCYVLQGNTSIPLHDWLQQHAVKQENCSLANLPHFRDGYILYIQSQITTGEQLNGIISGEHANDVQLSSIPKDIEPAAVMHFNKDGYSVYCREYNEYWQWVDKRNETRYQGTLSHGKNYDAKNMMHTFRLLNMAEEIAVYRQVIVHRNDRDFLLRIRNGEFEYNDLLKMAEEKLVNIETLYSKSDLPEQPDGIKAEALLIQIRESFYSPTL